MEVVLGCADQGCREGAQGVADGGSLGHVSHGHEYREGQTHGRAHHEADEDPLVGDDVVVHKRTNNRQRHADLAHQHALAGGDGMAQPLEREDEGDGRRQIRRHAYFSSCRRLNILSIRSVITNPPTTLAMEQATAMVPRIVESSLFAAPAMMMEPTKEMAEMALVSDISGVCSSGLTRRITSKPTKVASTNTNSWLSSSVAMGSPSSETPRSAPGRAWRGTRLAVHRLEHARMDDLAAPRGQGLPRDLVF